MVSCFTCLSALSALPAYLGLPSGQPVTYVSRCSYFLIITGKKIVRLKPVLQTTGINFGSENLAFESGSHDEDRELPSPHAGSHTG